MDECDHNGKNDLLDCIRDHFLELPEWLGFFLTTRPEVNIMKKLGKFHPDELIADSEKNMKDIQLYIVGPTPNENYLSQLKALVQKYDLEDQVIFTGSVKRESVMEHYSETNLMILPSVSEGLARVIFESQVTACPVLVTDAPGMGDIVIDGQTGYIFESNTRKNFRFGSN